MAGYKLPSDAIVVASQKENTNIQDFQAQTADPISTIKEATRQTLFSSKQTEVTERIAEVIAVSDKVTLPAELNYFGEQQISEEYKKQDWYCVICRIPDLHGVTPDPDIIVDSTGTNTFKDITRMRCNVGKFYCPVDFLKSKGRNNISVGNWVIVEFQDKTLLTNGIIKDIYISPVLARQEQAGPNGQKASTAFSTSPEQSTPYGTGFQEQIPTNSKYINPFGDIKPYINSPFGTRQSGDHKGIDLINPIDNTAGLTKVYAIASGEVDKVWRWDVNNGNGLKIKHDSGGYSSYIHLSAPPEYSENDRIERGEIVGYMGNTGHVSKSIGGDGTHLHMEVLDKNGTPVDPDTVVDLTTTWTPPNPPPES